jgi:hypothetical protein
MDPYLKHSALWPDVQNRLIAAIADDLSERVALRYYVGLERRTYLPKADRDRRWLYCQLPKTGRLRVISH